MRSRLNRWIAAALGSVALIVVGAGLLAAAPAQAAENAYVSVSAFYDGTNIQVSGDVRSSDGQGLSGYLITVYLNNSTAGSTVTVSDGTYSYVMAGPGAGDYLVRAQWAGDSRYTAASGVTSISIPYAETSLSLTLDPAEVTPGSSVNVIGSLTAGGYPVSYALVSMSVDYGSIDSAVSTGSDGSFTAGLTIPAGDGVPSTFTVSANYAGDSLYTAASNRASGSIVVPPSAPAEEAPSATPLPTQTPTLSAVTIEATPSSGMMNESNGSSEEGSGSPMAVVSIIFFAVALVSVGTLVILGVVSHAQKRLARDERRGFGTNFGKMW